MQAAGSDGRSLPDESARRERGCEEKKIDFHANLRLNYNYDSRVTGTNWFRLL
jgi:hypothetical protein